MEEVHALRRSAAGDHLDARREARRRDQLVAKPVDERLRLGEAVVVAAGDEHLPVAAATDRRTGRPAAAATAATSGSRSSPRPEPDDRRLDRRVAHRSLLRGHEHDRRCDGARPDGVLEHVEAVHRLRRARDAERRAGRELEERTPGARARRARCRRRARNRTGRAMIARASRAQKPCSGSSGSPGRIRLRAMPRRP